MKICDLNYLKSLTPSNPLLTLELIQLLLKQAPVSFEAMKKFHAAGNWKQLQYHAHKLGSFFDTIGIRMEFKEAVNEIEKYTKKQEHLDLIPDLLLKIEIGLNLACKELEVEN